MRFLGCDIPPNHRRAGANTLKPSVASPARNGVPKRVINMACEAFGLVKV